MIPERVGLHTAPEVYAERNRTPLASPEISAVRHTGRLTDRDRAPSLPALVAASPWIRTTVSAVMFYLLAFHGASAKSFIYVQF